MKYNSLERVLKLTFQSKNIVLHVLVHVVDVLGPSWCFNRATRQFGGICLQEQLNAVSLGVSLQVSRFASPFVSSPVSVGDRSRVFSCIPMQKKNKAKTKNQECQKLK